METRVQQGQRQEDPSHRCDRAPNITRTVQFIFGTGARLDGCFRIPKILGKKSLGSIRRTVGCTVPDYGKLQQDGETTWIGRNDAARSGIATQVGGSWAMTNPPAHIRRGAARSLG